ncbi:MAG: putative FecR [Bradyrhizobium sp.]|jgi:transmembrane sensor|nr:putative FecR [Bradyrhizobium sp.]MEA2869461.1 transrane sensor [Bradyrhizobium sp.]
MVMIDSNKEDSELTAIEREAHAWIRRLTSGEAGATDAAALRLWCGRSPTHAAAFSQASQLWEAFGQAGQSLRDDERISNERRRSASSVLIGRRALIGGALAASAAGVMIARPPLGLWPSFFELRADYRTAAGEQRQIAVSEGVSVQMNARTSISIGAGGDSDAVELIAGEASFKMPDRQPKSFSVVAAGGRTSANGARFDVRLIGPAACVTCLADEVRVEHQARSVTLEPRQQVAYDNDGLKNVAVIDPVVVSAWQQGLVIFNMTPLTEVIEELNRYRPGRIVLLNSELGRLPVNGRFRIDQPDEALAQIARAFGVRHRILPGGLVLLS